MDIEYSPWFRGVLKPVRVGIYNRELTQTGFVGYAYWDGVKWYSIKSTADGAVYAYKNRLVSSTDVAQSKWRGLAHETN